MAWRRLELIYGTTLVAVHVVVAGQCAGIALHKSLLDQSLVILMPVRWLYYMHYLIYFLTSSIYLLL